MRLSETKFQAPAIPIHSNAGAASGNIAGGKVGAWAAKTFKGRCPRRIALGTERGRGIKGRRETKWERGTGRVSS